MPRWFGVAVLWTTVGCDPSTSRSDRDPPNPGSPAPGGECPASGWELWASDPEGACACFLGQGDPVGEGWCALRAGDPEIAAARFGSATGDDPEAGLAVALDLADDPAAAGEAAAGVLSRTPGYRFDPTGLEADDLRILAARAALLGGDPATYRAELRALGGEPPNPYDPGSWGSATTAVEASLTALGEVR